MNIPFVFARSTRTSKPASVAKAVSYVLIALLVSASFVGTANASLSDTFVEVHKSLVLIVGSGIGSGFVIKSDATSSDILTAAHVVASKRRVNVYVNDDTSVSYVGIVTHVNAKLDLALIRIRKALPSMTLGVDIREGQPIAVAGYPYASLKFFEVANELKPSVHEGIISAVRLSGSIVEYSATTDHGNSGGPVFDTDSGYFIGVVSFSLKNANGAYEAIGPSAIRRFLQDANEHLDALDYATSSTLRNAPGAFHFVLLYSTAGTVNGGDQVDRTVAEMVATKVAGALDASVSVQDINGNWPASADAVSALCHQNAAIGIISLGSQFGSSLDDSLKVQVVDCWFTGTLFSSSKSKSQASQTARTVQQVESAFADLSDQVVAEIHDQALKLGSITTNFLRYGIPMADGSLRAFFNLKPGEGGAVVSFLPSYGSAARAGLQFGDLVISLNGVSLAGYSQDDINALFAKTEKAKTLSLLIRTADGGQTTIIVQKHNIRWYLSHPLPSGNP